jgi:hypothetical protein
VSSALLAITQACSWRKLICGPVQCPVCGSGNAKPGFIQAQRAPGVNDNGLVGKAEPHRVEQTNSQAGVAPAEVQRLFTAH